MAKKKKMKKTAKLKHERINDILLGPIERPLIAWFVKILPKWVTPDILTFTALFACVVVFLGYYLCKYDKAFLWLASFGLILNWFGDSLDGSVARYRKIERPRFGFFIDHTMDAIGIVLIFLGIGCSPYSHFSIAVLPLIGYLMMEVQAISSLYVNNVFKISYGRLGPTEARAFAVIGNALLFFLESPSMTLPFGNVFVCDFILVILAAVMLTMFIYSVNKVGRKLSREESQRTIQQLNGHIATGMAHNKPDF